MSDYPTLAERKRNEVARLKESLGKLRLTLETFSKENHGRFILFGSMAKGNYRPDSDVDLIVDFPEDASSQAIQFAQDTCYKLGLKPDIIPYKYCSEKFLSHIMKHAEVLE